MIAASRSLAGFEDAVIMASAASDDAGGGGADERSGVEALAVEGRRTMRPSRMTTTRSDMPRISGSSDETMMTPALRGELAMKSCTAALEPMSMPLVGSSRMMTLGLVASHLAITTFCWLPPESWPTVLVERGGARSSRSVYRAGERELLGQAQEARREVRSSAAG